ncbi:homoserine O-succinyltransferase [Psychrobium sp. 1_MG-2023]|uniref:homoserine O-acetyltransferase MetA n=1 Tax=Psychrobium sp. 1_MG-2023 TaxID=3062624 RepID=UPI000C32CB1D|nr:homoserine O-succinyltransferase [Psychrobium sp. 1_MG-2023]MDP2561266.1 homoserine O-succinyltransferase [Psychrobium sp. 1_MG-2023]PKF55234.1 homoserine O-succinyltransferase [Alteromonadales bacterium alter-6D02]
MPINIPDLIPAKNVLRGENIFVMSESRAISQQIRPMKVLLLNLMPNKIETETQLLRLLANTPLQVDVEFLRIHNKESKNTPQDHMNAFYRDFNDIKETNFDGLIITGAPLGQIDFDDVSYWEQIKAVFDWSQRHVTSTLFLCWAAHAAFYHLYGLERRIRDEKIAGVFLHQRSKSHDPLLRGFDDEFWVPHSRFAQMNVSDIGGHPELEILADSPQAGAYLVVSNDRRNLFVLGHPEYNVTTLNDEYHRDVAAGESPDLPQNYYPEDNPKNSPKGCWRSHANLLLTNWLNYYVYQITPFDLNDPESRTPWEN